MQQSKFSIAEPQIEFLNQYSKFGFKDKSSMVRVAINELKRKLELEKLMASADLYAEIYSGDKEISELTDSAINDWPE